MKRGENWEQFAHEVMSGHRRGAAAALLRGALAVAEPFYSSGMRLRNRWYDRGVLASYHLGRATISVGNLTAGGTGKTPFVRWLAGRFIDAGIIPAIILRGYKSAGGFSDEAEMLRQQLGDRATVACGADRVATARRVLAEHPRINVFLLDDAFQHRRARRDLDIVLINAAEPFGYDHVHPRGLLREPLDGLRRAGAIVLTHGDQADNLPALESRIRALNAHAPIYRTRHVHTGLRSGEMHLPMDELHRRRFILASGVGSPRMLRRQLASYGENLVASHTFADHHYFTSDDLRLLRQRAEQAGAQMIVVTEKDWVKIARLGQEAVQSSPPLFRLEMQLRFTDDADERALFNRVLTVARSGGS